MGEKRSAYRILVGKPEGKRPLGRPRLSGRIILKWKLERIGVTGLMWLRTESSGEFL
jgi:hypothetical protein